MIQRVISVSILMVITVVTSVCSASSLYNMTMKGTNFVITGTTPKSTFDTRLTNLSPGFTLTNPKQDCKPGRTGDCVFTVSDTIPATVSISGSATHYSFQLCTNAPPPNNCESFDIRFAYVANRGVNDYGFQGTKQISVCPIINGVVTPCNGQNPGRSLTDPLSIALNASGTMAYVSNLRDNTLSQCTVNNGSLVSCTTVSGPFSMGVTLTMGPTGSIYVTNYAKNTVTMCPTNQAGAILADKCWESPALFKRPAGMAISKSGLTAYVVNSAPNMNFVSMCSLLSNGHIQSCTPVNPDFTFNNPGTIVLNSDETIAYITNNGNSTESICAMVDGAMTSCTSMPISAINNSWGGSLSETGHQVYITSMNNNSVSICSINDRVFGACSVINDPTFGVVGGITLSH